MKNVFPARAAIATGVAAVAALSAAVAARPVHASDPPASSAAASASAPASAPPPDRFVRGKDIPAEPSKEPKNSEWKDGKRVQPHRGDPGPCEFVLVREWLRLTCKEWAGATLVAGDPKGVKMWTGGKTLYDPNNMLTLMVLTPIRRGRAQVFSLMNLSHGYEKSSFGDGGAMSIVWREGQEDPVISFVRRPEG